MIHQTTDQNRSSVLAGALMVALALSSSWASPVTAAGPARESRDEPATTPEDEPSASPRLVLDLGWSYGISYGDSLVAAGWPVQEPAYFERIGLQASTNLLSLQLLGVYQLREGRTSLLFSLPFGVVQQAASPDRLPGLFDADDFHLALGEPSIGVSYQLLRETAGRPRVEVRASGSAGNTSYSSLGDGFESVGLALIAEKQVSRTVSVTATGSYTYRFDRGEVVAGNIAGLRGGIGLLTGSGAHRIEVEVGAFNVGATGLATDLLLPAGHDDAASDFTSYLLSVSLRRAGTRHRMSVELYAPEGELGLKDNSIAVHYTLPLKPREPWRILRNQGPSEKERKVPFSRLRRRARPPAGSADGSEGQ